ncbi:DUF4328 domain-containing protein [Corallococcus terminator]
MLAGLDGAHLEAVGGAPGVARSTVAVGHARQEVPGVLTFSPVATACAQHPDQPATRTCPRCGSFACEQCQQRHAALCASCRARLIQRAFPSVRRWAVVTNWAVGFRAVSAFLSGDAIALHGSSLFFLGMAQLVAELFGVVGFLTWQYRAVRVATQLGVSRASPHWALLCWFIPGLNLFKPYQVLRDLWRDLGGESSRLLLIRAWWCLGWLYLSWSLGHEVLVNVGAVVDLSTSGQRFTEFVFTAMLLLTSVLCISVVRCVQRRLDQVKRDLVDAL